MYDLLYEEGAGQRSDASPAAAPAPQAEPAFQYPQPVVVSNDPYIVDGEDHHMDVALIANIAIEYIKMGQHRVNHLKSHVSEVYSPPRVTALAHKVGLSAGWALDLTQVDPDDGKPWDFNSAEKRQKVIDRVKSEQPFLLIGCPPCTVFSQLFKMNVHKLGRARVSKMIREGIAHVEFCIQLYRLQIEGGRYFLHEHPTGAWSWKLPSMINLLSDPRVEKREGHMCPHSMTSEDKQGTAPVLKPTSWVSNSSAVLSEVALKCEGGHRHVHLTHGRARAAQVYPEHLCYAILRGLRNQLISDKVMSVNNIGTVCEDPEETRQQNMYSMYGADVQFIDDLSGQPLDPKLVTAARAEEIRGAVKHHVYTKVPISECWNETGNPPIGTKWVDINKGDANTPDIRCRWVGREFKGSDANRDDLYAATPPLEAKKALIVLAASQRGVKGRDFKKLGFIDIRKAYFHAKVKRPLYVVLPPEALEPGETGVCGKLNYSLYGTRDAAHNWEEAYTEFMISIGFKQGLTSPCIFHHVERDVITVVHGDDFTSLATENNLKWLTEQFKTRFEIKDKGILGPDIHDAKEVRLLNRIIAWDPDGIRLEADQRHAEILVRQLGLESAKGLDLPGVKDTSEEDADEASGQPVDAVQATLYRACAARCNFLSLDRPDIQFAAKEVSRGMAKPTPADFIKLKRLARYIKQNPRAVFKYRFQDKFDNINVYTDTDWAGCVKTRRSTQGGLAIFGGHCVKSWSTTQAFIALSSGEAEYYGVVKGSSVGLGLQAMLADMGVKVQLHVHTDATAAKGIASRKGLSSRTRHVAVHFLWVQEHVISGNIVIHKVKGDVNPADLLTKYLGRDLIARHTAFLNLKFMGGRAESAPELSTIFCERHGLRGCERAGRDKVCCQPQSAPMPGCGPRGCERADRDHVCCQPQSVPHPCEKIFCERVSSGHSGGAHMSEGGS